jgi:hypothetical protein
VVIKTRDYRLAQSYIDFGYNKGNQSRYKNAEDSWNVEKLWKSY